MGLIDKIQSKIELYKLEQKYSRRKNRTTFTTGATYVDGEYVYNTNSNGLTDSGVLSASSTGSSSKSHGSSRTGGVRTESKRSSMFFGR